VPTVRNYHVKALTSDQQLVMLYRIEPGYDRLRRRRRHRHRFA
jgi:hypothetical protein